MSARNPLYDLRLSMLVTTTGYDLDTLQLAGDALAGCILPIIIKRAQRNNTTLQDEIRNLQTSCEVVEWAETGGQ